MIRKNLLFCKIIRIKTSSKSLFDTYMSHFKPDQETCPICGSFGNCRIHAYYGRHITDFIAGKSVKSDICVLRVLCNSCRRSHAILPDVIIPYSDYSLFFVLRLLDIIRRFIPRISLYSDHTTMGWLCGFLCFMMDKTS